jgi:hypothetical protein
MPSKVGASHNHRWLCCRSAWRSAASGSATSRKWVTSRRSWGGSSRRAASTRTGSAAAAVWVGRSWVPWANTLAWRPTARRRPGPGRSRSGAGEQGPAVRTKLLAAPAPRWRRARSQLAVEGAGVPWSAPAAPQASTAASSLSQQPSRRSSSRRRTSTRWARTPSGRPARFWAARSSTSAASACSPSGSLSEHLFELMAATSQPHSPTQAPTQKLWTTPFERRGPGPSRPLARPCLGPQDPGPPRPATTWGPIPGPAHSEPATSAPRGTPVSPSPGAPTARGA